MNHDTRSFAKATLNINSPHTRLIARHELAVNNHNGLTAVHLAKEW
jgi:hypothetical protein